MVVRERYWERARGVGVALPVACELARSVCFAIGQGPARAQPGRAPAGRLLLRRLRHSGEGQPRERYWERGRGVGVALACCVSWQGQSASPSGRPGRGRRRHRAPAGRLLLWLLRHSGEGKVLGKSQGRGRGSGVSCELARSVCFAIGQGPARAQGPGWQPAQCWRVSWQGQSALP